MRSSVARSPKRAEHARAVDELARVVRVVRGDAEAERHRHADHAMEITPANPAHHAKRMSIFSVTSGTPPGEGSGDDETRVSEASLAPESRIAVFR